jgi:hypothetical protein
MGRRPYRKTRGAHGEFSDRAATSSPQLWASVNRKWLALAAVDVSGLVAVGYAKSSLGRAKAAAGK